MALFVCLGALSFRVPISSRVLTMTMMTSWLRKQRARNARAAGQEAVEEECKALVPLLSGPNGVLLFLYSCIATRGTATVIEDLGIDVEPLVSTTNKHGSGSG